MPRARRLAPLLAALLCVALAPAAHAATAGGTAPDPTGDSTGGPGTDIVGATWDLDPQAGRLSVAITLAAPSTSSDWGEFNATFRDTSKPGCGGSGFAVVRGSSKSSSGSAQVGTAADGVQPDGSTGASIVPVASTRSEDGRTTTFVLTHQRLVGRSAGCVTLNISHNGVLDALSVPASGAPAPTGPAPAPGSPGPTAGPPAPGTPAKPTLLSSRTLRFRKGVARVTIGGVPAGQHGRVRLALAGGTTLALGRYQVTVVQVTARLTLTARGRAWLRRHRSGKATLIVASTQGTPSSARFAVTIRR
jgi:hypothetical protein